MSLRTQRSLSGRRHTLPRRRTTRRRFTRRGIAPSRVVQARVFGHGPARSCRPRINRRRINGNRRPKGVQHLRNRGESLIHLRLQAAVDGGGNVRRSLAGERGHRRRLLRVARDHIHAGMWRPPGKQLEKDAARRIDIRTRVELAPQQLFRREMRRGRPGQRDRLLAAQLARHAEVAQLERAVGREHKRRRLHVAMNDVLAVEECERRADLARDRQQAVGADRARAGHIVGQALAHHQLGDQERRPLVVTQLVDLGQIGVVEGAGDTHLAPESLQQDGASGGQVVDQLQSPNFAVLQIVNAIDVSTGLGADEPQHLVALGDDLSCVQFHEARKRPAARLDILPHPPGPE